MNTSQRHPGVGKVRAPRFEAAGVYLFAGKTPPVKRGAVTLVGDLGVEGHSMQMS